MATLWDYQNQLRKIAEHRTSGAEQEILAVYSSVLQRLQGIVGRYYTVYSNGEGTLSAADLRLAGQYKGFLQDVLRGLEQLSEPQQEAIRSAVESAYTVCYDGMAAAVKEAASGSTSLQNALHGLSASTPETVVHIVEHPMQKLTLSHVLQKKRRQITHKIRQTLSVGLANGDSYPQMASRIADALNGDYKKAIRVVRTEANRAINRGFQDVSEEAAHLLQDSEYLEVKEWCSAEDGDVRDAHRKLDGKVIPATEAFEIDGKKAQCPGGFGVAELDINCRCFLKYALVRREDFEKKHGKIRDEALTSGVDGGIIKMGKAKKQVIAQAPADFSKYTISEDIESVQVAKNSLISSFGLEEKNVSLDGICNAEVLKPFADQLIRIHEQTGFKLPNVHAVEMIDGDPCCIAGYKPMENCFYISSRYFNSKEALLDTLKSWASSGILPKQGKSIRYLAEHESAHMRIPDKLLQSEEAQEIQKTFLHSKSYNDNDAKIEEFFADAIAIYRMNPLTTDTCIVMAVEYLKKAGIT